MSLYWLSFCDAEKPEGEQFLGAAIVRAVCLSHAVAASHLSDCNPGGEVQGIAMPASLAARVTDEWLGRLLSREDIARFDAAMGEGEG